MKKNLLMATSLFIGGVAFGQFTQGNTPVSGDGATLYVIDSLAPNFESQTGSNVVWDYSGTEGYGNETRSITAINASVAPHDTSFPSATEMIDLEGVLQTYSSNSSTELTGEGFVFTDNTLGDIIAKFDTDQAIRLQFPMDETSSPISDLYSGTLIYTLPGFGTQTTPLTGKQLVSVDGKGTLKLAQNDYTDVLRYKIVDTLNANVTGFGDIELVREQYEYYDHSQSNLPIFMHVNMDFGIFGGGASSGSSLVMSIEDPTTLVGLDKNQLSNVTVYPVPASDQLTVELPTSVEKASIALTDAQGRQVLTSEITASQKTIDVASLNKGMYVLTISNDITTITKNIVIR